MERLLTALFWLWLLSTIVGYFATLNYANQPHDLILLQRAQALAEHMKLGSGRRAAGLSADAAGWHRAGQSGQGGIYR